MRREVAESNKPTRETQYCLPRYSLGSSIFSVRQLENPAWDIFPKQKLPQEISYEHSITRTTPQRMTLRGRPIYAPKKAEILVVVYFSRVSKRTAMPTHEIPVERNDVV